MRSLIINNDSFLCPRTSKFVSVPCHVRPVNVWQHSSLSAGAYSAQARIWLIISFPGRHRSVCLHCSTDKHVYTHSGNQFIQQQSTSRAPWRFTGLHAGVASTKPQFPCQYWPMVNSLGSERILFIVGRAWIHTGAVMLLRCYPKEPTSAVAWQTHRHILIFFFFFKICKWFLGKVIKCEKQKSWFCPKV